MTTLYKADSNGCFDVTVTTDNSGRARINVHAKSYAAGSGMLRPESVRFRADLTGAEQVVERHNLKYSIP